MKFEWPLASLREFRVEGATQLEWRAARAGELSDTRAGEGHRGHQAASIRLEAPLELAPLAKAHQLVHVDVSRFHELELHPSRRLVAPQRMLLHLLHQLLSDLVQIQLAAAWIRARGLLLLVIEMLVFVVRFVVAHEAHDFVSSVAIKLLACLGVAVSLTC